MKPASRVDVHRLPRSDCDLVDVFVGDDEHNVGMLRVPFGKGTHFAAALLSEVSLDCGADPVVIIEGGDTDSQIWRPKP